LMSLACWFLACSAGHTYCAYKPQLFIDYILFIRDYACSPLLWFSIEKWLALNVTKHTWSIMQ